MSSSSSSSGGSGGSGGGWGGVGVETPPIVVDHLSLSSPSDQLCYVHCNFCDTVLAVSVPNSSLFKTVTVRCGHCSNLLSVNMRALLLSSPPSPSPPPPPTAIATNPQLHLPPSSFFSSPHNLLEELRSAGPNLLMNNHQTMLNEAMMPTIRGVDHHHDQIPKPPPVNRPPEKRQRVPSAYNRFIKDEIQRIKAENPDISHREAFSAAAKNWAHFPHIHFGLMPDHQPVKKANVRQQQQEGEHEMMMKEGFLAPPTNVNVGVGPY
uniref:Uncharacterized protein n=1 Tax=Opuntia streptacantha TaxID=393608 RepID=A0A7C8YBY7_OPUST